LLGLGANKEINPSTAQLPGLWAKFYQDEHNDSDDAYSNVKIKSGKYLIFEGKGEMPLTVIETWKTIWKYFSAPGAPRRACAAKPYPFHSFFP